MKKAPMLSAAAVAAAALQAATPAAAHTQPAAQAVPVPIALQFQVRGKRIEPERLLGYEKELAERTGFMLARARNVDIDPESLGPCGTVSGSGNDWDDSKQDC
ncbi:hypothetical protein [Ottowia sp.]|uniref:hypothetical protein n=1 Tax=Ottowia sp. TaxID=1898956 RepID=UPI00261A9F3E|nr:hypothetical protein [Ottowia sp.]